MKIRLLSVACAFLLISTAACSTNNAQDEGNSINQLGPDFEQQSPRDREINDQLGFVRYKKDELELGDPEANDRVATIDRTKMADMITQMILQNDDFEEVATLVTDQEVLIAYKENGDLDEHDNADIARKTAMSVMPRYFDIYVTNNDGLMNDIHSLHNSSTQNRNYDNTIQKIIQEMKKTPQGHGKNNMNK
ncbi:MAG TPA: YhcN/YlaJ family sporulation lipoprotein [Virgibacillus sp.]|nr:YhcN/YlaJ family sporulation lipoprotein [Virgibacillus sp.]